MNTAAAKRGYVLPFTLLAAAIVVVEWWIARSLFFQQDPDLISIGITMDLVIVIPALFYLLVVRPKKNSPLFVIPVLGLCMFTAGKLIPVGHQDYLLSLRRLSPVLDLLVIGMVAVRLRQFAAAYRHAKASSMYFTDALFSGFQKALSDRVVFGIIFVEFFLIYFSLAGWFLKPPPSRPDQKQFTYHRKSGYAGILAILMLVLIVETFAVHMIVTHWSALTAWILTVLSLYSMLWLIGDFHAVRVHPIIVSRETLYLRTGLRWRADILIADVQEITTGSPQNSKAADYLRASVLWPRASIHLKTPVEVHGLFGRKKVVSRIGVSVDDPESLKSTIEGLSQSR